MRARVRLSNLSSERGRMTIIRNLRRIMDIRIVDIDMKDQALCFLFQSKRAYEEVKRELVRLGFPIEKVLQMIGNNKKRRTTAYDRWETSLD